MSRSKLQDKFMKSKYDKKARNKHRCDEMPKNRPSKYITSRCHNAEWLQEPTNFKGHKIQKNGHRMVSGIIRAKVKEEIRKDIEDFFEE